ncbi:MAG: 50S ribosomal protein L10 [Deltaproteobacteria bacterium]|nr:50S ribosomal protein L10 [Deltaproteobacteria bacterium]MBW2192230.1 50S ribosomal protein L10 [Deltaproteobacteria bacterium]
MKLDKKKEIVKALHDKFGRSKIVIVTDYKGLNVTTINDLRRKLREAEIEYKVVKNSLLTRAADDTDVALIKDYFVGPSAIALSYDDPVAPAKLLTEFAKENKKLEIKAGILNGKVLDVNAIKLLSALPSREVLLGQFLSVLVGVPTSIVRALNDMPKRFLNVLQAIKEQKETA